MQKQGDTLLDGKWLTSHSENDLLKLLSHYDSTSSICEWSNHLNLNKSRVAPYGIPLS